MMKKRRTIKTRAKVRFLLRIDWARSGGKGSCAGAFLILTGECR